MLKRGALAILACLWSLSASAADKLDSLASLNQAEFLAISKDLAAIVGYKATAPAEPMGLVGFDLGISFTSVQLESPGVWTSAMSSGDTMSTILLPKLHAYKGLPFDIDIGAYYFSVPGSNIKAVGGEVKYAILDGGVAMPAVSARLSTSSLSGVTDLAVGTKALDFSISKGILFLTPYAGVGRQWTTSEPSGTLALAGLTKESFSDNRSYVGVVLSPGFFRLTIEHDTTGDVTSNTVKFSMGF